MSIEPNRKTKIVAAEEFMLMMKKVREEAEAVLLKTKEDMKKFTDQRHSEVPEYKIGDWVWLSLENINTNQPSKKLGNKCNRSFEITEIILANTVQIQLPRQLQLSMDVINVSRLMLYNHRQLKDNDQALLPLFR